MLTGYVAASRTQHHDRFRSRVLARCPWSGYYDKPRIDKELLARHAHGLIGKSARLVGEVLNGVAYDPLHHTRRHTLDLDPAVIGPDERTITRKEH
ncbi:MAG: hypothetical protein ACRDFY_00425 [Candidatus Limnocylindria bacterium]